MTDELVETERVIVAYIESHVPEDCMLDKISRGTNKSRATVLKYLETLNAKGVLEFRLVGRSKLWLLKHAPEKGLIVRHDALTEPAGDVPHLKEIASELHRLKAREESLHESMESPDRIVFTIDNALNIISSNDSFDTLFKGRKNFRELVLPEDAGVLERILTSKESISVDIGLLEKPGMYSLYRLEFSMIEEHGDMIGSVVVGESLSGMKRTKKDLEALIYMIRTIGSMHERAQIVSESMKGIKEMLLPYSHGMLFTLDGGKPRAEYSTFQAWIDGPLPSYLDSFLHRCARSMETISANDFEVGSLRSELRDPEIKAMFAIPIIGDEKAAGVILLVLPSASVDSIKIEDVEMVADEIAGALKMLRLERVKAEYVNTLVAMNRISGIINSVRDEDSMLERSIASTMETLGFDMGCVYLGGDDEELLLRVHKNMPESLRSMCISGMFKDLFSKAFARQNLVYITADSKDYDTLDPAIRANGVRTLLILPIKNGDKVIGLLNMGSREIREYDRVSLENLGSIGLQLGIALERSKLAIRLKTQDERPVKD